MNSAEIIEIIAAIGEVLAMVGLTFGFTVQKKKIKTFHNDTLTILQNKINEIERKLK